MNVHIFSVVCLLITSWTHGIKGMNFVVIGDWGDDNEDQVMVAQAMSDWCAPTLRGPCEFILNSGDNFYSDGVDHPDHPRFNTTWRFIYDLPNIADLVWYNTIGNHDYGVLDDRELNQVLHTQLDPLWYMPWLWYDFYKFGSDGAIVHIIVIDTMSIMLRKHDPDSQLEWIEDVLNRSTADWVFMIGHSPPYSSGEHAPGTLPILNFIVPLVNEYEVDVLFAGDEHNLEHITSDNHTDHVISGAGGRGLYEFSPVGESILNGWGLNVDYFGYYHGFLAMDVTKTSMTIEFVDANDLTVKYAFTRYKL